MCVKLTGPRPSPLTSPNTGVKKPKVNQLDQSKLPDPKKSAGTTQTNTTQTTKGKTQTPPVGSSPDENTGAITGGTPQLSEGLQKAFSVLKGVNDGDITPQDVTAFKQLLTDLKTMPMDERKEVMGKLGEAIKSLSEGGKDITQFTQEIQGLSKVQTTRQPQPAEISSLNHQAVMQTLNQLTDGKITQEDIGQFKDILPKLQSMDPQLQAHFLNSIDAAIHNEPTKAEFSKNIDALRGAVQDLKSEGKLKITSPFSQKLSQTLGVTDNPAKLRLVKNLAPIMGEDRALDLANKLSGDFDGDNLLGIKNFNVEKLVDLMQNDTFKTMLGQFTEDGIKTHGGKIADIIETVMLRMEGVKSGSLADKALRATDQEKQGKVDKVAEGAKGLLENADKIIQAVKAYNSFKQFEDKLNSTIASGNIETKDITSLANSMGESIKAVFNLLPKDEREAFLDSVNEKLKKLPVGFKLGLEEGVISLEGRLISEETGLGGKIKASWDLNANEFKGLHIEAGKYLDETSQTIKDEKQKRFEHKKLGGDPIKRKPDEVDHAKYDSDDVFTVNIDYKVSDKSIHAPDDPTNYDELPTSYGAQVDFKDLPESIQGYIKEQYAKIGVTQMPDQFNFDINASGEISIGMVSEQKVGDKFHQGSIELKVNLENAGYELGGLLWDKLKDKVVYLLPGAQLLEAAKFGWEVGRMIGQTQLSDGHTIDDLAQKAWENKVWVGSDNVKGMSDIEFEANLTSSLDQTKARLMDEFSNQLNAMGIKSGSKQYGELMSGRLKQIEKEMAPYKMGLIAAYKPGAFSKEQLEGALDSLKTMYAGKQDAYSQNQFKNLSNLLNAAINSDKTKPQAKRDEISLQNSNKLVNKAFKAGITNQKAQPHEAIRKGIEIGREAMQLMEKGELSPEKAKDIFNKINEGIKDILKANGFDGDIKNVLENVDKLIGNDHIDLGKYEGIFTELGNFDEKLDLSGHPFHLYIAIQEHYEQM